MTPEEQRFWEKTRPTETGCVEWTGARATRRRGYGVCRTRTPAGSRVEYAHRYAFALVNGPIPTGMFVCHRCDNTACVNPNHLFLGTHAENMADMVAKRRSTTGERDARAALTEASVRQIRRSLRAGETQRSIAQKHGVTQSAISDIRRGRSWKHVAE